MRFWIKVRRRARININILNSSGRISHYVLINNYRGCYGSLLTGFIKKADVSHYSKCLNLRVKILLSSNKPLLRKV